MVIDWVSSAKFWLRPVGKVPIVKRNPEEERCEGSSDTDDSYNLGRVFHLSIAQKRAMDSIRHNRTLRCEWLKRNELFGLGR